MADFPYTQVTGKLKALFEKIQQVGKPDIIDKKWLSSIGLTDRNAPTLIPVLRFIGFIDQSGKPTERWMSYRDKSRSAKVLAEGIIEGYADLFQTYNDAYRRNDDELKAFFVTKTTAGGQAVTKTMTTFKNLCALGEFDALPNENPQKKHDKSVPDGAGNSMKTFKEFGAGITININIQLTLPNTTDESVYDKLFFAMKKHLLT